MNKLRKIRSSQVNTLLCPYVFIYVLIACWGYAVQMGENITRGLSVHREREGGGDRQADNQADKTDRQRLHVKFSTIYVLQRYFWYYSISAQKSVIFYFHHGQRNTAERLPSWDAYIVCLSPSLTWEIISLSCFTIEYQFQFYIFGMPVQRVHL